VAHAISRRASLTGLAALAACGRANAGPIRIGYQKDGVLVVARQQDHVEKRLKDIGHSVEWAEFPSGPPLLEALSADAIDFGATGDTPPIFAQSSGSNLAYAAAVPVGGRNYAIMVPPGSTLARIQDLKGRRVAFTRGSSAHYFVLNALASVGLTIADIEPAYLSPHDARAAFIRGSIDAWGVWDPFFADAQRHARARVLSTAEPFGKGATFLLTGKRLLADRPALHALLDELRRTGEWIDANRATAAQLVASSTGIDLDTLQLMFSRVDFTIIPMAPWAVARQQRVADTFARLGIIPRPITVRDAVPDFGWK
jgi:sulfonate transport system substrate-binding protein